MLHIGYREDALVTPRALTVFYIPDSRGYHTATLIGTKIFFIGGSDNHDIPDVILILDTETKTWSRQESVTVRKRFSHTATLIGAYLFIFGGCDTSHYVQEMDCLDLNEMKWRVVSVSVAEAPPEPCGFHTTVYHDSRLFVFGGASDSPTSGELHILNLGSYAYMPKSVPKI